MRLQNTNFFKNIKTEIQFLYSVVVLSILLGSSTVLGTSLYTMSIVKNTKVLEKAIEFSVYIKCIDEDFELTAYQCALQLGNILESENLQLKYIKESSELQNEPNMYLGVNNNDGKRELIFVSYVGSDKITKQKKLVGRFVLEGVVNKEFDLEWNFDGIINTIIIGNNFNNITKLINHRIENSKLIEKKEVLEHDYNLSCNFPNPFNSTTKVKVTMQEEDKVSLTVYSLLGEKIMVVFDGYLVTGIHQIKIEASNLSSGIYIYQLVIKNKYSFTRKMNLVK